MRTPTATVTDLGTEFGVEVDKQGGTTSHVFRGAVRVQVVAADGQAEGNGRVLHENESARVERDNGTQGGNRVVAFVPASMPSNFVREIPKRAIKVFDLVDVVAGGDGFSGRRNRGIDITNGRTTEKVPYDRIVGDGKYHRVEAMPFVDGVFVPDGRTGRVQVDSAGHVFMGFPESEPVTGYPLWAGGAVPIPTGTPYAPYILTELGGIDYASSGHGVLFLHANKGITFDLEAIRRANPGHKVLRFRAVAGNTEPGRASLADIWVLVNGHVQFQRCEITRNGGAFVVVVPLGDKDRFLTLAATDGGDTSSWDWVVFGDPRLELLSLKHPTSQ